MKIPKSLDMWIPAIVSGALVLIFAESLILALVDVALVISFFGLLGMEQNEPTCRHL